MYCVSDMALKTCEHSTHGDKTLFIQILYRKTTKL